MQTTRPASPVPVAAVVVDGLGALLSALGLVVVFAPQAVPAGLAASATPAVGWTAFGVGMAVSAAATWQILQTLLAHHRRSGQRR